MEVTVIAGPHFLDPLYFSSIMRRGAVYYSVRGYSGRFLGFRFVEALRRTGARLITLQWVAPLVGGSGLSGAKRQA